MDLDPDLELVRALADGDPEAVGHVVYDGVGEGEAVASIAVDQLEVRGRQIARIDAAMRGRDNHQAPVIT